ncbi:MFS transporter [Falsigemmobacter faecalis]|uniref:MFS transporter n=1 Tax=Falsigemmobacter faecalis TaxID=2488730 RepID=A0A3P3DEU8_9RHOB|nr:MFS transporter [Falsigemmobacter faecalis]RRH72186.1 MFS transporter [Falsigemmobacter faecalis]
MISHALRQSPVAVISLAQLFGTSLWFSSNAVTPELSALWGLTAAGIGWLTAAVQAGFIAGTLLLALSGLADRFRATHIFAVSAVLGAALNAGFALLAEGLAGGLVLRFLTGLSLAGIYPIGMKLMVRWAPEKAGWGLSVLVAMLTLGTALPHGMRAAAGGLPWQGVILAASGLALVAAGLVLALGEPQRAAAAAAAARPPGLRETLSGLRAAFRLPAFRSAALGYFGHMWELYAFWTLVPLLLAVRLRPEAPGLALYSFGVIAIGALGCILGGLIARRTSGQAVARASLVISGACCLLVGAFGGALPLWLFGAVFLIWGASVVSDSPQFSAICATACPPALVGSALSMMNAVGFAITMVSIALTTAVAGGLGLQTALLLSLGPLAGLFALRGAGAQEARRRA